MREADGLGFVAAFVYGALFRGPAFRPLLAADGDFDASLLAAVRFLAIAFARVLKHLATIGSHNL